MSSREEILRLIRRHQPATVPPTEPFMAGIEFDDPVSQFAEVLASVGGRCAHAATADDATRIVGDLAREHNAEAICSQAEGIDVSTFDLAGATDPHALQVVDLAVMPGRLAVAENAAVWVATASPMDRTLCFLSQHLALVVPRENVVSNLHQAYDRIDAAESAFGVWISGPSKTADIEQSLVLGAHGPRSLTVILRGG